jgi:L-lactate dehydrogenase complex protein LldG
MTARDEVLLRIRSALADSPAPAPPARSYRRAGATSDTPETVLDRFAERVADYRASVHRISAGDVRAALDRLLAGKSVVVPDGFPEPQVPDCIVLREPLSVADLDAADAVLTTCALGIAETGTIVLDCGDGQGRRALTLVPDHHVVVINADQVVAGVPDAIAALDPTRPMTFISGPSATSDIELNRVEGVHGPRNLDVVLVG